ncbi:dockerin type I domain-containing protein [Pseudobythopirellula maris]|nr:dockerin type I domain-containing protein [Pseudobythopirellula maris]
MKLIASLATSAAFGLGLVATASAQVLVMEDFESYADTSALNAVWDSGNGTGELIDEDYEVFVFGEDPDPVGIRAYPEGGQGVYHPGGTAMEYLPTFAGGEPLLPTTEKSIVVQGEMFDIGVAGNKRMSIGLRSNAPENLIELGQYNDPASGPYYRAVLFPAPSEALDPSWQQFELPLELDGDDENEEVSLGDIGEVWYTYRATITPTDITFQLDVFSDGLDAATGEAGWDSTVTHPIITGPNGYDSLRIGGPSGIGSGGGGMIFDNLLLELVDAAVDTSGDYNGNGIVDAADFTLWRDSLGDEVSAGTGADGNGDGFITDLDYDVWVNTFGNGELNESFATAVPEPASALLAILSIGLFATRGRRA